MNKDDALAITRDARFLPDDWAGEPIDILDLPRFSWSQAWSNIALAATLANKEADVFAALMKHSYMPSVKDENDNVWISPLSPLELIGENNIARQAYESAVNPALVAPNHLKLMDYMERQKPFVREAVRVVWRADRIGPAAGIMALGSFYTVLHRRARGFSIEAADAVMNKAVDEAITWARTVLHTAHLTALTKLGS